MFFRRRMRWSLSLAAPRQPALRSHGGVPGLVMRPLGRALRVTRWVSIGVVTACAMHAALAFLACDG